ncbi:MAG: nitrate- and nitrite sensing domain-containing protein, partial [Kutzneria sp.]|nr:nitrate- and nitrite sensing domain-containing protein [Kutzneria sp.]
REQDVVLLGIGRGYLTGAEQQQLIKGDVGYDNEIAIFNTIAPDRWRQQFQQTVPGVDANVRDQLLKQAIAAPADPPPNTPAANRKPGAAMNIRGDEWNQKSDATVQLVMKVEDGLRGELRDTAAALRENASNQVGTESVILAVILLLAGAIGLIVSRYLLRSLSLLRNTALDVAKRGLPEAVARIREGRGDEVVIDPVPVHTTEEFGQLARAFDEVHGQAVRSASEQAALRSNLSNIFVNLSRRSQGLVERQLRLMEQLERHEENPEQLANLFKLDHLATRMRRNNENLMALSGLVLARRFSRPLPLGDVLRAAVSEIEHYQRAMVRSAPPVSVVGYAAGDLVRLIAELLDNATAFSRSDTQVVVDSGHRADGSVVIEVTDEGIGLGDAELAEINQRVSAIVSAEVPVSRQMGLFVVGQLASRHSFRVHFSRRTDAAEGLVASVGVPAELIVDVTSTVLPAVPGQNGVLAASVPAPASAPEELAPGEPDARTQPAGESVFHAPASGVVQWPDTEDADDVEVYDDVWSLPDEDEPVTVDPAPEPQTSQPTWFAATVEPEPEPEPLMTPAADPPAGTARHTWFDSEPDAAGGHPGTDNRTAGRHSAVPNRAGAAEPFTAPMPVQELTPQWPSDPGDELVDLPKRVPRASLFPALDERRTADPGTVATSTNADRNRGFLASYQSGIRADNTRTDRDRQASPIQNERGQNS